MTALALLVAVAIFLKPCRSNGVRTSSTGASNSAHKQQGKIPSAPLPARHLEGSVLAADGPVPNARVTVMDAFGGNIHTTSTNASGKFALDTTGNELWIGASSPDYGSIVEPVPRDAVSVVLRLPGCATAVYGSILDASGGPIAGARIEPLDISVSTAMYGREVPRPKKRGDAAPIAGVESGQDGKYRLCVWPGKVTIIVRADGYARVASDETIVGQIQRDFELVPAVGLDGRAVGPDGSGLEGAVIELAPQDQTLPVRVANRQVLADASGEFTFEELAPGEYVVQGHSPGLAADPVPVSVTAGRETLVLRFVGRPTLKGQVLREKTPVPSAVVTVRSLERAQVSRPVFTDAQGRFVAEDVPTGKDEIAVVGYKVETPADLTVSGSQRDVIVQVRDRATVKGRVELDGRPVARALVVASGAIEKPTKALSEADGSFVLSGLLAGHYVIQADSDAEQSFTTEASKVEIDVKEAEMRDGVVIVLDGGARIEGHVRASDNTPIVGAAVSAVDRATGDLCLAETLSDGSFSCRKLAGGRYSLSVRVSPRTALEFKIARGPTTVSVARRGAAKAELVVNDRRGTIRGRVVDSTASPIPDVMVRALEEPSRSLVSTDVTDSGGYFVVTVATGARHSLLARDAKGALAIATGIEAGASEQIIVLARGGELRGQLRGFPATGAQVTYARLGTRDLQSAFVSGDTFRATGLVAGEYAVIAQGGSLSDAITATITPGNSTEVTLTARPMVSVQVRVIDFLTNSGLGGVRCRATSTVAGLYIFGGAATIVGTTGTGGLITGAIPKGRTEVSCDGQYMHNTNGLVVLPAAAEGATVDVFVVSTTQTKAHNSIGAALATPYDTSAGTLSQIQAIRPDGAAEQAGLRVGDQIISVDGKMVTQLTSWGVSWLLGQRPLGSRANVSYQRAGSAGTAEVVIEPDWSDH